MLLKRNTLNYFKGQKETVYKSGPLHRSCQFYFYM